MADNRAGGGDWARCCSDWARCCSGARARAERHRGIPHGDTSLVSAYIASLYPAGERQPTIWLTEAAAQITDSVTTYVGTPEGCNDAEVDDPLP